MPARGPADLVSSPMSRAIQVTAPHPSPVSTISTRGQHHQLFWTTDAGWSIRQRYLNDALTTSVSLDHRDLKLAMYCNDCVDFHRRVMVRKIKIKNLASHPRVVRLMHHQDFNMLGTKIGDTAYFDPDLHSIVHYRGSVT